jgi:hypothetical protein
MNTKKIPQKHKTKTNRIIFSIIFLIIALVILVLKNIKIIGNDKLYSLKIQSFFGSNISIILKISMITNHFFFFLFFIIFVDNYKNIFISFILIQIFSFGYYFSSLIKIVFQDKNPYLISTITIYECDLGWGLPCENIIIIIPFFLTLYNILTNKKNIIIKILLFTFSLIIILFNCLSVIIIGKHLLSQVIISVLIGFSFYELICGFNFQYEKGNTLYVILTHYYFYLLINVFMSAFLIGAFFYYNLKIRECKYCIDNKRNYINFNDNNGYKVLNKGSLLLSSIYLGNIFCYFSYKCQFTFILKNNRNHWFQFNFNEPGNPSDYYNESITIVMKETKWNHTSKILSFLRLIVSFILCSISFIPYFIVKWESNFWSIFFVKYLLSFFYFILGIFFIFKFLFKKLHIINFILFIQIEDQQDTLISFQKLNDT